MQLCQCHNKLVLSFYSLNSILQQVDPQNTKALLRRGLAFEGMERFKLALQDMKALLYIDPRMDVANKAQHRIQSALRREQQYK